MSERDDRMRDTAQELRDAFDAGFARPAAAPGADRVSLLALRVAGERVAVRVLETAGLIPAPPVVPVPSRRPELLGISGVRGAVVPIFSLARLLGRPDDGAPGWVVLAGGGAERVGLAVAAFEGHLVAAASELRPAAHAGAALAHAPEALHAGGEVRPVLGVPSLLRAISNR